MFAPQNSLITIHEQDDMHIFFFYHLQCSLFRCCLQCFNYLHYLSDDGDVSFDDDFDKIGNSDIEDEKHSKKGTGTPS